MTTLATLTVEIKGNNDDLMKKIQQAKEALKSVKDTPSNGSGGNRGGSNGGANDGFFSSKSVFGVSRKDMFGDLGAIYMIDRAGRAIKDFADTATTELAQVRMGFKTTGEAAEEAFSKIPGVGTAFSAGRSIRELIETNMPKEGLASTLMQAGGFKPGKSVDEINFEIANMDRLTNYFRKTSEARKSLVIRDNNAIQASEERINALRVEGPAREVMSLRNAQAEKLRAIEEENRVRSVDRKKAADDAKHEFEKQRNQAAARLTDGDKDGSIQNAVASAEQQIAKITRELNEAETEQAKKTAEIRIQIARETEEKIVASMVDGSKRRQVMLQMQRGAGQFISGSSVNEYSLGAAERQIVLDQQIYDIQLKITALGKQDTDQKRESARLLNDEIESMKELHKQNEDLIRSRLIYQTQVGINAVKGQIGVENQFGNVMGIGGTYAKEEAARKAAFEESTVGLRKEIEDLNAKVMKDTPIGQNVDTNPDYKLLQLKTEQLKKAQEEYNLKKKIRDEDNLHAQDIEKRDLLTSMVGTQAGVMQMMGNGIGGKLLDIRQRFGNQIEDETYAFNHAKTDRDKKIAQAKISALGIQRDIAEQQALLETGGYTSRGVGSQRSLLGTRDTSSASMIIANKVGELTRVADSLKAIASQQTADEKQSTEKQVESLTDISNKLTDLITVGQQIADTLGST